jgi:hypothetical protein
MAGLLSLVTAKERPYRVGAYPGGVAVVEVVTVWDGVVAVVLDDCEVVEVVEVCELVVAVVSVDGAGAAVLVDEVDAGDETVVDEAGGAAGVGAGVVREAVAVVEAEPGDAVVVEGGVPADFVGVTGSPLSSSWVWISSWTAATSAAMASGVPLAPNCDSALSCRRSALSSSRRLWDGCDFRVTTI